MVSTDAFTLWLEHTHLYYGHKRHIYITVTTDMFTVWLKQTHSHYGYSRHTHIMTTARRIIDIIAYTFVLVTADSVPLW